MFTSSASKRCMQTDHVKSSKVDCGRSEGVGTVYRAGGESNRTYGLAASDPHDLITGRRVSFIAVGPNFCHRNPRLLYLSRGRAGGDRTHDRGIMRWMQSVGSDRWCRICPELNENSSGGVGSVRWCRIGMWDFPWDFLANQHLVPAQVPPSRYAEVNVTTSRTSVPSASATSQRRARLADA